MTLQFFLAHQSRKEQKDLKSQPLKSTVYDSTTLANDFLAPDFIIKPVIAPSYQLCISI